jgi:hypothetical protein
MSEQIKLGRMLALLERDKLLSIIYEDIDKHDSLGRKEALIEIEDPEVAELVQESLLQNKNLDKVNSYWNDKYQTCFLVVDWS